MIYYIKNAKIHPFNNDVIVLNEDGGIAYSLNATGFFIRRLFLPSFSIQDTSGSELLKAKSGNNFFYKNHVLLQDDKYKGFVKELSYFRYMIEFDNSKQYQIKIKGLFKTKFELSGPDGSIAEVFQELLKWRWRIELPADNKAFLILAGLALIYSYFSNTGTG